MTDLFSCVSNVISFLFCYQYQYGFFFVEQKMCQTSKEKNHKCSKLLPAFLTRWNFFSATHSHMNLFRPVKYKGKRIRECSGGVNMIKLHLMHVFKRHNEIPYYEYLIYTNTFFKKQTKRHIGRWRM
jgi:hypothetical protein